QTLTFQLLDVTIGRAGCHEGRRNCDPGQQPDQNKPYLGQEHRFRPYCSVTSLLAVLGTLMVRSRPLGVTSTACSWTQRPLLHTLSVAGPSGTSSSLKPPFSSTAAKNGELVTITEITIWGYSVQRTTYSPLMPKRCLRTVPGARRSGG